jgi:serine phosphatase RsbU (regulator of sigma subunit)
LARVGGDYYDFLALPGGMLGVAQHDDMTVIVLRF